MSNYTNAHASEMLAKSEFSFRGFEILETPESSIQDFVVKNLDKYYGVQVKSSKFNFDKNRYIFECRKRNMSKELFGQEFGAEFSVFEGKVWDFNRDLDTGDFPYDPNLPTYCSIDFGYRMPAVLFMQTYWDGELEHIRVFDSILHKQNIKTEDLIKMIKTKGYPIMSYYGDPAGSNVQGQSGAGDMEIFRRSGIRIISARDRMSRNLVASIAYTRGFFESADGIRRVHVDRKCKDLIEDFEEYRYPESEDGKPIKEEPLKDGTHDHGNDAFRYFIINRFPMRNNEMKRIQR